MLKPLVVVVVVVCKYFESVLGVEKGILYVGHVGGIRER